jgi:small subunit ribosomal protein S4
MDPGQRKGEEFKMARYTGPKRRLSRREGLALFAKDAKALEKKGAIPPGQHGIGRRRRVSEYGLQLREKQKAKRIYGILEKQFKKYINQASKVKGATGLALLTILETRLDNAVYRLGFARSRAAARQLVSHGHIKVDGKKVNLPSFVVGINQTIEILPKMRDNTQVKNSLEQTETLPEWLERQEQSVDEQLIVEFYSR